MSKEHFYELTINWTGNKGTGTSDYKQYDRNYTVSCKEKENIFASADPAFRGDHTKYNPEEFLLAALSSCHMLWFLHLCADAGVIVVEYIDNPTGIMIEAEKGGGRFKEVTLNPLVTVTEKSMCEKLDALHKKANEKCFIANSVNFPVIHKASSRILPH